MYHQAPEGGSDGAANAGTTIGDQTGCLSRTWQSWQPHKRRSTALGTAAAVLLLVVGIVVSIVFVRRHEEAEAPKQKPAGPPAVDFFACTDPPLSVRFQEPLGQLGCGVPKLFKTNASLGTAPHITYLGADSRKGYVLMMIDPDAPHHAPIRHWLVVNIPGAALLTGDVGGGPADGPYAGQGEVLQQQYRRPGPPNGTGYHRYAQFLFAQPEANVNYSSYTDTSRQDFHYFDFIER